ncbi:ankyrin repeat-containing domain protein [Talaromyces proteolyticus]|uniref:Ankyrin repeat-containing domain protein n=1 Tax=Talaromyces proteolyticus TaxID=1131652 RepID=A0AAD4KVX3_9EURO|nr:ankyrin repeat-containing domain protein [Talaromyces proteolyticus]KAH8700488.1 ankyrin repeat-containing domain protein [Talaromyces proteolyticus]
MCEPTKGKKSRLNWSEFKETIRTLYIDENLPLRGPGGVIEVMKNGYNFSASNSQYQKHLRDWGFRKYQKGEDLKKLARKCLKRQREGKPDPIILMNGKLVPKEKMRRILSVYGFTTTLESFGQESNPPTPSGFEILSPQSEPGFLVNLPYLSILQFQDQLDMIIKPAMISERTLENLSFFIKQGYYSLANTTTTTIIDSLVPNEILTRYVLESGYDLSNAIANGISGIKQLSWAGPTIDSFVEKLFPLAIKSCDLLVVKRLLQLYGYPHDVYFKYGAYGRSMLFTPLQLSCLYRDRELTQILIKAGANTTLENGLLVLAILGEDGFDEYLWREKYRHVDIDFIRILVQAGADVNSAFGSQFQRGREYTATAVLMGHNSPLTAASLLHHIDLVDYLVSQHADVHFRPNCTSSALSNCIRIDYHAFDKLKFANEPLVEFEDEALEISRILIAADADPNASIHYRGRSCTVLEIAMRKELLRLASFLISAGAKGTESSLRKSKKRVPLPKDVIQSFIKNVSDNSFDEVAALLQPSTDLASAEELPWGATYRGNITLPDYPIDRNVPVKGCNALMKAIETCAHDGHFEILSRLFDVDFSYRTVVIQNLGSALYYAVSREQVDIVDMLLFVGTDLEVKTELGQTALIAAINAKNTTLFQKLMDAGAAVDLDFHCNNDHASPSSILVAAVEWGEYTVISTLIEAGADVNALGSKRFYSGKDLSYDKCCDCTTPLGAALQRKDSIMVKYLVEAGASVNNPPDCFGVSSPLSEAIEWGDIDIVRYLLNQGSDTSDHDALQKAIRVKNTEPIELLLKAGADPNTTVRLREYCSYQYRCEKRTLLLLAICKNPPAVKIFLEAGAEINTLGPGIKYAPLQLAAQCGGLDTVQTLLDYGADPNSTASRGAKSTALQIASRKGNIQIVRLLLERGADVNAAPALRYGATALQFASIMGFLGIAQILIKKGADVNALPAPFEGRTALEGAAEHGRLDILQLLFNAGAQTTTIFEVYYERALQRATKNGHNVVKRLLESYHQSNLQTTEDVSNSELMDVADMLALNGWNRS